MIKKPFSTCLLMLCIPLITVAEEFSGPISVSGVDKMGTVSIGRIDKKTPILVLTGGTRGNGDIAVKDEDTLQIGQWKTDSKEYINWLELDTADVAPSTNNGNYVGSTLTRLRIKGDNSQSQIFHLSGCDNSESSGSMGVNMSVEGCFHREELSIQAVSDSVGNNNNGSGVHYYGNNDTQHAGAIAFFTNGKPRLAIDYNGRIGVGSKHLLNDYESRLKGRFNVIAPNEEPGIYIEGAGPTEGDIAWKKGEVLQLGTWSINNEHPHDAYVPPKKALKGHFTQLVAITSEGEVKLEGANDEQPGYINLDTTNGNPPKPNDCSKEQHYGRMLVDEIESKLYICVQSGWIAK